MIRMATAADAEAAGRIYDPIVERTAISFELDPPGPAEMERRIGEILPFAPWLVDERGGEVPGLDRGARAVDGCGAGPLRPPAATGRSRACASWCGESSNSAGTGARTTPRRSPASRFARSRTRSTSRAPTAACKRTCSLP